MERERSILCGILIAATSLISSCLPVPAPVLRTYETRLIFDSGQMKTKALDPDEALISDVSILIFDEDGYAEECIWIPDAGDEITVRLIKGNTYSKNTQGGLRDRFFQGLRHSTQSYPRAFSHSSFLHTYS